MHIWPKNWSWYDPKNESSSTLVAIDKASEYIDLHLQSAHTLNKPIVLSEFGFPRDEELLSAKKSTTYRDQFYRAIFNQIQLNKKTQGVFAGCNFWGYAGVGVPGASGKWQKGDDFLADPPQEPQGLNSVFSGDTTTLQLIKKANLGLH
jgi:mannan endo-1,4-beta-mannosidase